MNIEKTFERLGNDIRVKTEMAMLNNTLIIKQVLKNLL